MDKNLNRTKAVVLMSGGMDSCVTAAIAAQGYEIAALHASYGQRTERREAQCFNAIADHFGVETRLAVRLDRPGRASTQKTLQLRDVCGARHVPPATSERVSIAQVVPSAAHPEPVEG